MSASTAVATVCGHQTRLFRLSGQTPQELCVGLPGFQPPSEGVAQLPCSPPRSYLLDLEANWILSAMYRATAELARQIQLCKTI